MFGADSLCIQVCAWGPASTKIFMTWNFEKYLIIYIICDAIIRVVFHPDYEMRMQTSVDDNPRL